VPAARRALQKLKPQGREALFDQSSGRALEVAEKLENLGELGEKHPSAAKADFNPAGFYAGVETPASLRTEFFRSLFTRNFTESQSDGACGFPSFGLFY
jgi:hypothetical protein